MIILIIISTIIIIIIISSSSSSSSMIIIDDCYYCAERDGLALMRTGISVPCFTLLPFCVNIHSCP